MTRKSLIIATVVLGLLVGSVGIAYAITNGQPDGDDHPYVALLVFGDETPEGVFVPYWSPPIRPVKDAFSVWLRGRSTAEADFPFTADFDDFRLRRVKTGVPMHDGT